MFFRRRIDFAQQPFSRGSACLRTKTTRCLGEGGKLSACGGNAMPVLIELDLQFCSENISFVVWFRGLFIVHTNHINYFLSKEP